MLIKHRSDILLGHSSTGRKHKAMAAKVTDRGVVMAYEQDRSPSARDLGHLAEALRLEVGVPDRKDFVNY